MNVAMPLPRAVFVASLAELLLTEFLFSRASAIISQMVLVAETSHDFWPRYSSIRQSTIRCYVDDRLNQDRGIRNVAQRRLGRHAFALCWRAGRFHHFGWLADYVLRSPRKHVKSSGSSWNRLPGTPGDGQILTELPSRLVISAQLLQVIEHSPDRQRMFLAFCGAYGHAGHIKS